MLKEVKPARYKVLKIIVLLSIQAEGKRKDDDDYGDEGKRKCVGCFVVMKKTRGKGERADIGQGY